MSIINLPSKFHDLFAAWVRLEPRPRSRDLSRGVAARVADPLWFLARQWQVGELAAENVGSPIGASVTCEAQTVSKARVGSDELDLTATGQPLESYVERESVPMDWRMRIRIGQR